MSQTFESIVEHVHSLSEERTRAELYGDTHALSQLLADDFVGIGPRGFMLTKDEWMQRHQSGALRYEALALDDVRVRVYADAAILVGRETQTATYQAQPVPGEFRTTLIWVRQQGDWRLAGQQLSPIMAPPAPPTGR